MENTTIKQPNVSRNVILISKKQTEEGFYRTYSWSDIADGKLNKMKIQADIAGVDLDEFIKERFYSEAMDGNIEFAIRVVNALIKNGEEGLSGKNMLESHSFTHTDVTEEILLMDGNTRVIIPNTLAGLPTYEIVDAIVGILNGK